MSTILAFVSHDAWPATAGAVLGFLLPHFFKFVDARLPWVLPSEWKAAVAFGLGVVVTALPVLLAWAAKGSVSPDEFYQAAPWVFTTSTLWYETYLKGKWAQEAA